MTETSDEPKENMSAEPFWAKVDKKGLTTWKLVKIMRRYGTFPHASSLPKTFLRVRTIFPWSAVLGVPVVFVLKLGNVAGCRRTHTSA